MHVANLQQCKNLHLVTSRYGELTSTIGPAALPDGNIGELYGYQNIVGHAPGATGGRPATANNRRHNADSFAFLASGRRRSYLTIAEKLLTFGTAWYLNSYKWTNGAAVLVKKAERPPDQL